MKRYVLFLLMMILLVSVRIPAQELSGSGQPSGEKAESQVKVPNLSEIIPLAAELSGRLAELEQKVQGRLDVKSIQEKCANIEANLEKHTLRLNQLKEADDYKASKFLILKQHIDTEDEKLDLISKSINKEVLRLENRRKDWLARKKDWEQWQSAWLEEDVPERLYPVFTKVNQTIDKALGLIAPRMDIMLAEQERIGNIQEKIYALTAELNKLIEVRQIATLLDTSPPMFTFAYFSQFGIGLWNAFLDGVYEAARLSIPYVDQLGWSLLIQSIIFIVLSLGLYRNRQLLSQSDRWRFLGIRPFSISMFFVCVISLLEFEYEGAPPLRRMVNVIIGGIVLIRIMNCLLETRWKKQFVIVLITFLITNQILYELNLPLPLLRLYLLIAGLVALLFCRRWARECNLQKGKPFFIRLFWLGVVFNAFVVIAQIFGKHALSGYLFISLIRSITTVLIFMLLMRMIRGTLEWLFRLSALRQITAVYSDDNILIPSFISRFIGFLIVGLIVLPGMLMIWSIYPNLNEATKNIWNLGFPIGSIQITIGHVIISISIVFGSFIISRVFQILFLKVMLHKGHVEKGVRLSIERLIHYFVLFFGFLLAVSLLGFELTKFTILLSALGVGIGFGLQSIVNNFVSGLILLFERPIREGDTIEIGGKWAEVKRIGLRATTVQTFDQADLIVPNADLATQQVTNWTLSSRQVRLIIPVGVAYGSDVGRVFETLYACAKDNPRVSKMPEPLVLFLNFGESSLDFELRIWIDDALHRLTVKSELHQEIDRRFREANIVIAFPQRDVHLKNTDKILDQSNE